jgi:hypothetical protein
MLACLLCAKTGREQMQQHAMRGRQSYSITWSARASSIGGISKSDAFGCSQIDR